MKPVHRVHFMRDLILLTDSNYFDILNLDYYIKYAGIFSCVFFLYIMKKLHIILIYFICILLIYKTSDSQTPIFPNIRIFPSTFVSQSETDIVRHPLNPSMLFASAITINAQSGFKSEGVYVSTNYGINWFGTNTIPAELTINHGGDPGPMIDKDGIFYLAHIGSFISGMYVHYSADSGTTWSFQYTIASGDMDKGDITTDDSPSSPYFGRTYISYVAFIPPYPVFNSYTINGGVNWSTSLQINSPPQRCQGADSRVDPNGNLFVCWSGTIPVSPYTEDYVGLGISSNGGQSWYTRESIYDMNGINGNLPAKSGIRVNGLPKIDIDKSVGPRNGWIYIITTEKNLAPAGSDPDIIMHRSTDGGMNWSGGIRVNQDPLNNGKTQFFPAIRVDEIGGVAVVFYDDRNTAADSAEMYLAYSKDGGNTWNEYVLSTHRFKPQPIAGGGQGYQGDNIGMTSGNNYLYPLWMDNSTGIYQAWLALVDLSSINVKKIGYNVPDKFELLQNYPNPFNPETNIKFNIPKSSPVKLRIYDISGKLIVELINEFLSEGKYEIKWNATNYSSGIYFYRIETENFSNTKKMILIK